MRPRAVTGIDPAAPVADGVERIVRVRLDELCAFAPRVFDPAETVALHDMRIAAKRLRYVLETTAALFGPYAAEAAKRARELQDLLGEIHDCDVLAPRVEALVDELRADDVAHVVRAAGRRKRLDPGLSARAPNLAARRGLEVLVVHLRARREQLFARFLTFWTDLERDGFRSRLEHAVAERPAPAP